MSARWFVSQDDKKQEPTCAPLRRRHVPNTQKMRCLISVASNERAHRRANHGRAANGRLGFQL